MNDIIESLEAFIDESESELVYEAAIESFSNDFAMESVSQKISSIGSDLKNGFAKLRKAKNPRDASEAKKQIDGAIHDLRDSADDESEENKKKLSTAAKIGIAAAGATAVAIIGATAGDLISVNAVKKDKDIKGMAALLAKFSNLIYKKILNGFTKATDAIAVKDMRKHHLMIDEDGFSKKGKMAYGLDKYKKLYDEGKKNSGAYPVKWKRDDNKDLRFSDRFNISRGERNIQLANDYYTLGRDTLEKRKSHIK